MTSGSSSVHTNKISPALSTSGYFQTVWYDPVGITLSEVKDNISFSYDGTYVDSYSGSWYLYWDSNTGWYYYNLSNGGYITSAQTAATQYTDVVFQNDTFCFGQTTVTYYNPNEVVAHGDGSVTGWVNTWSDSPGSGCSAL